MPAPATVPGTEPPRARARCLPWGDAFGVVSTSCHDSWPSFLALPRTSGNPGRQRGSGPRQAPENLANVSRARARRESKDSKVCRPWCTAPGSLLPLRFAAANTSRVRRARANAASPTHPRWSVDARGRAPACGRSSSRATRGKARLNRTCARIRDAVGTRAHAALKCERPSSAQCVLASLCGPPPSPYASEASHVGQAAVRRRKERALRDESRSCAAAPGTPSRALRPSQHDGPPHTRRPMPGWCEPPTSNPLQDAHLHTVQPGRFSYAGNARDKGPKLPESFGGADEIRTRV